jgi:carbamoyl-phosphate synthase large subunit
MKSVGESMGIGRTFVEAFLKARRGLEIDPEWRPENLHPWFAAELERAAPEGGAVVYRRVDSCAGEVAAASNYFYSTRGETDEEPPAAGRSVVILGSGPNRIGQGIEFDYCCVHAAQSFRAQGYEAVMVNCNPETVSTDYDTSDRLYFEPLDEEAVLAVLERERPVGVCIQFGGQTPLKLARAIERAGFRILGTPFDAIDLAEDRERFGRLAASIGVRCPEWGIASTADQAVTIAERIGYPVLVRPSYVLGGRAMRVCYSDGDVREAMEVVDGAVLVDRFLENAIELDVDALCDGAETYVAAVMEHIEEAGIHSGDSSCVLPAPSDDERVRDAVRRLGPALGVIGLLNVQLAIAAGEVYVLEVNPRASRTVPFASKATGVNLVDAACRLAAGSPLSSLGLPPEFKGAASGYHVKAAVLPFARFPGADPVLGPEMRSTGEVMASAADFATAFGKAERAAGRKLPTGGTAFLTVRDADKIAVVGIARSLAELGFELIATAGTARALVAAGIDVVDVDKGTPVVELVRGKKIDLIVNTPAGGSARRDGYAIREAAVVARVPCITTLPGARAAVEAMANARAEEPVSLQERHAAGQEVWRAAS